ncbi:MAG: nucleoside hydrolase [Myxococcales bacterium]|nr:nucleoside hydrolase [Myxococcales bacterium]
MSLLVDTDPALGLPFADIDDALALYALVRAGVPIVGLTTCFGNAPGPAVTRIARQLGSAWGLPVHAGALGPGHGESAAVEALVAHRGDVLALAPLTNIAAALLRGARWRRLVVLGGTTTRLPDLRPLHTTELNFALDRAAARVVLPHVDVLVPMEVCRRVVFTGADLDGLPDWMRERCRQWVRLGPLVTKRPGFHPWDLLAALQLVDPALFTASPARVEPAFSRVRPGRIRLLPGGRTSVVTGVDAEGLRATWRGLLA